MFRFCAGKVGSTKKRFAETQRDDESQEYYLAIEGFLLHLRNLLSFFTNRKNETSDLIINEPDGWAGRYIEQQHYSDLIAAARDLDRTYGRDGRHCYDLISKFLEHCTIYRHTEPQDWNVEAILAQLNRVLNEFERRFTTQALPRPHAEEILSGASTATVRQYGALVPPDAPARVIRVTRPGGRERERH